MKPRIYPKPHVYKIQTAQLELTGRRFIRLQQTHSENFICSIERFISKVLDTKGIQLQLTYAEVAAQNSLIRLVLVKSNQPEAYDITTDSSGYTISASDECGLFRGLASAFQVFVNDDVSTHSPYVTITDQPDFSSRGVMLDISRCKVPSMSTLKALIDQFAQLKFNQVQLYTEHTFAFSNHPTVWAQASPLTADEILEIKHYAAARYIDLVPNLNCFGHFERWLRHSRYHQYAESPNGFMHPLSGQKISHGSTLAPTKKSLKLVRELQNEYFPLFDSEFANVGGDEPWELGLGASKARCDKEGTTQVYIDFLRDIQGLVEKRGRQMMFWSDIVLKQPSSLKQLSKELIAMNWGYEGNHPFKRESAQVAEQKIPFYVCPGTSSWNSLVGRTKNMQRNIQSAAKQGKDHDAAGLLVTDWGDHGHHQYLPISYPGFAVAACESWNQGSTGSQDLADMVNASFLHESTPHTADVLIRLGKVLELAKSPIRNATIFNRLVFSDMNCEPTDTAKIPACELIACKEALENLKQELCAENQLVGAELENAINMAQYGLNRVLCFRQEHGYAGKQVGYELDEQIALITGQHEQLWLARNRVGGMRESISHLTRTFSA